MDNATAPGKATTHDGIVITQHGRGVAHQRLAGRYDDGVTRADLEDTLFHKEHGGEVKRFEDGHFIVLRYMNAEAPKLLDPENIKKVREAIAAQASIDAKARQAKAREVPYAERFAKEQAEDAERRKQSAAAL